MGIEIQGLGAFLRAVEAQKLRDYRQAQARAAIQRARPLRSINFLK